MFLHNYGNKSMPTQATMFLKICVFALQPSRNEYISQSY